MIYIGSCSDHFLPTEVIRERCINNITPHFDYLIEILSFTQKVKEACVDFWKHCVWGKYRLCLINNINNVFVVMNLPQNILFKLVEQIIFMLNDKLNSDDLKFLLATLFFNLSDKNVTIHFYYDAKQLVNLALSALQHLSITSTPKRASWAISILTPLARLGNARHIKIDPSPCINDNFCCRVH